MADYSFSEMSEPTKSHRSMLIPLSETVTWKVENLSLLLKTGSFGAMRIEMEVGLGPVGVTKWEISLHSSPALNLLQARARLLSITGHSSDSCRVPHNLTFWVKRHGRLSLIQDPKDSHRCKEAWCGGLTTTYWRLLSLDDLQDDDCGIRNKDDDSIELLIKLTVFGSDIVSE